MSAPMPYKLLFHELAWQEWGRLDGSIRVPLKKKLLERLQEPRIPASALSGMPDCYKIKLRQAGYRLVYRVDEDVVYVTVIALGKRDKNAVYAAASQKAASPTRPPGGWAREWLCTRLGVSCALRSSP